MCVCVCVCVCVCKNGERNPQKSESPLKIHDTDVDFLFYYWIFLKLQTLKTVQCQKNQWTGNQSNQSINAFGFFFFGPATGSLFVYIGAKARSSRRPLSASAAPTPSRRMASTRAAISTPVNPFRSNWKAGSTKAGS